MDLPFRIVSPSHMALEEASYTLFVFFDTVEGNYILPGFNSQVPPQ